MGSLPKGWNPSKNQGNQPVRYLDVYHRRRPAAPHHRKDSP